MFDPFVELTAHHFEKSQPLNYLCRIPDQEFPHDCLSFFPGEVKKKPAFA